MNDNWSAVRATWWVYVVLLGLLCTLQKALLAWACWHLFPCTLPLLDDGDHSKYNSHWEISVTGAGVVLWPKVPWFVLWPKVPWFVLWPKVSWFVLWPKVPWLPPLVACCLPIAACCFAMKIWHLPSIPTDWQVNRSYIRNVYHNMYLQRQII
jgi:hypothetical protein